jgi:branched-chain amino acid aminotransferase
MNGELLPWQRAQVHVLAHALHFGTSVFEGLRAYEISERPAILCGRQHFERLICSCRIARVPSPLNVEQWMETAARVLKANRHHSAYLRPLVFRGGEAMRLDGREGPVEAALATLPMETYLGAEALRQGVDVQVSSWRRPGSNTAVPLAKIGGQYVNNQAVAMEAHDNGFSEGIALDTCGFVSEGSGENVFLVYRGRLLTPMVGNSALAGITRECVITIAHQLGYEVVETSVPREMLYVADEIFFTGTAVEICPIRSVDRIPIGNGHPGAVTRAIQKRFFGIVHGEQEDTWNWLTRL